MTLIGWWKLDGNAKDSSVNNLDGTPSGVSWVKGKIGQGAYFDEDTIDFPTLKPYGLYKSYSLCLWIYYENSLRIGSSTSRGGLIEGITGTGANIYSNGIRMNNTSIRFYYDLGSGREYFDVSINDLQDRWSHIVVTYDGDKASFFQDGSFIYEETIGEIDSYNEHDMRLGNWEDNYAVIGTLDDVRIYNHALSPKEVKELSRAKVGHWKMNSLYDGFVADSSGYGNDGDNNGAIEVSDSKIGSGALEFDGSSDYVDTLLYPQHIDNTPISFSAWINSANTTERNKIISWFNDGDFRGDFEIYTDNDLTFNMFGQSLTLNGATTLQDNTWYHAVFVWKPEDEVIIYLNGEEEGKENISFNQMDDGAPFRIAQRPDGSESEYSFNGKIDDVRIYATALSEDDVKELYKQRASLDNKGNFFSQEFDEESSGSNSVTNEGVYKTSELSEIGPGDGLVGWWRFDEGSGSTARDSAGDNDGSLQNGPEWVADSPTNGALEFSGDGDYVEINTADPWVGSSAITVSVWHKFDELPSSNSTFLRGNFLIELRTDGDIRVRYHLDGSWRSDHYASLPSEAMNSWHHICAVWDGSNARIFINGGVEEEISEDYNEVTDTDGSLTMPYDSSDYPGGKMDDVRIYNLALSAEEVKVLYDVTRPDGPKMKKTNDSVYVRGEFSESI